MLLHVLLMRMLGIFLFAATLLPVSLGESVAQDTVLGKWTNIDGFASIEIYRCDPYLCGKIISQREPLLDSKNPDPSKRAVPQIGLRVLWNMVQRHGVIAGAREVYQGRGYSPDDGITYDGYIFLQDDKLITRGCAMLGLVCTEYRWRRDFGAPDVPGISIPIS